MKKYFHTQTRSQPVNIEL